MNKGFLIKAALFVFVFSSIGAHAQTKIETANSDVLNPRAEIASVNAEFPADSANRETDKIFSREFNPSNSKAAGATFPRRQTYVRPTKEARRKRYLSDAFGVPALIGATFGATFSQIGNNPPEWNKTVGGFGKRFASSYGTNAIRNTVSYGISEAFKLDNLFERSSQKSFGKRLSHVFVASYTTRTKSGKRLPDFPQFIGTYSASIIANETWMPDRFSYKDGLRDGNISLGIRFGVNLLREFIFTK